MRITALEEYGLRCLVQLARHGAASPMTARDIAAREGLTVEYVTQLLVRLRQAGLVRSVRGARGGFLLEGDPEKITMGDVARALGEPLLERLCASFTGGRPTCIHDGHGCGILGFWTEVADKVHGVLDGYTLAALTRKVPEPGAHPPAPRPAEALPVPSASPATPAGTAAPVTVAPPARRDPAAGRGR